MPDIYNGCTRPLKAFHIGYTENGKKKYKITNYEIDHLENGIAVKTAVTQNPAAEINRDWIEIPCGKCPGCRLRYSREWRDRCIAESLSHEYNFFITLTYDNEHARCGPSGNLTLFKRDLQLFWKRLRTAGYKFSYFACGEYGDQTHRPHYHALVFGLDLSPYGDLFVDENGHRRSSVLEAMWYDEDSKEQLGFVEVGEFNEKTAAYVSRYTYKKAFQDLQLFYDTFQVEPQFVVMSRRPAIGKRFFDDNGVYMFWTSGYNYSTDSGGRKIMPTRYWKKKLEEKYPGFYEEVKNDGVESQMNKRKVLFDSDPRPYTEVLKDQEYQISRRTSALRRRDLHETKSK